ncbi:MAG: hypothetical protein ACPGU1_22640, partial [Myxococcota bacterium]
DTQSSPPAGSYGAVTLGFNHTCALEGATIGCWGDDTYGQASPPSGDFSIVDSGQNFACARKAHGAIACWGHNPHGQTDVPDAYSCGNSVIEGAEACDDGNLVNGDGCDASCALEGDAFAIFPAGLTYAESQDSCASLGGNLASIFSSSENELARVLCADNSTSNWGCLLGLKKPWTHWESGEAITYTPPVFNTHDGEPHGFIYKDINGWEDKDQDTYFFPYICRLPTISLPVGALDWVPIP